MCQILLHISLSVFIWGAPVRAKSVCWVILMLGDEEGRLGEVEAPETDPHPYRGSEVLGHL